MIVTMMGSVCGWRLGVIKGPRFELLGNMCGLMMRRVRQRAVEGGHQGQPCTGSIATFLVFCQSPEHPPPFNIHCSDFISGPINNESFYCCHTVRVTFG